MAAITATDIDDLRRRAMTGTAITVRVAKPDATSDATAGTWRTGPRADSCGARTWDSARSASSSACSDCRRAARPSGSTAGRHS